MWDASANEISTSLGHNSFDSERDELGLIGAESLADDERRWSRRMLERSVTL